MSGAIHAAVRSLNERRGRNQPVRRLSRAALASSTLPAVAVAISKAAPSRVCVSGRSEPKRVGADQGNNNGLKTAASVEIRPLRLDQRGRI